MADREKVIEHITDCVRIADCQINHNWVFVRTEILKDALVLLKKQEPVEPIPTEDDDWICGACNNSVVGTEELNEGGLTPIRFNYCPNCGRAVKWG